MNHIVTYDITVTIKTITKSLFCCSAKISLGKAHSLNCLTENLIIVLLEFLVAGVFHFYEIMLKANLIHGHCRVSFLDIAILIKGISAYIPQPTVYICHAMLSSTKSFYHIVPRAVVFHCLI